MARYIKSLVFNLEEGKDIPRHREHRSKKGRNSWNRENSPQYFLYKKKKEELKYKNSEKNLLYFTNKNKIRL